MGNKCIFDHFHPPGGRIEVYGTPSRAYRSKNICGCIIPYHNMSGGDGLSGTGHRVTVDTHIRLVDTDVITEHHKINQLGEPAILQLAMLDISKPV